MNLVEAAALFIDMTFLYEKGIHDALEEACVVIEDEAKHVLGTYEYNWPPLAPSTIARKVTGDSPGLETSETRDSVGHVVSVSEKTGYVGSNEDKAVWFELGRPGQPPRPFLGGAAEHKGEEAADAAGHRIVITMFGPGM